MAVQFRDYYETLGVSKTATEDEIRTAFRKLARKHHPDVAKDKKAAEEKFKEINEAYEVLGDPEKRKKYDQLGADWNQPGGFQPPPGWGAQQPSGGFYQYGGGDGGVEFEFGGTGFSDSSRRFSAVAAGVPLLVASADVRQQPSAGVMSKRTSWLRSRRLSMDRQEQFRCAARVQT